jgi:branched-chain amino acid transport system substrate-binding protein
MIRKFFLTASALAVISYAQAQTNPLKIAMIEALTGPSAQTGIGMTEGMRYGIQKINDAGGFNGAKVQLLEYDNQGGPTGAADKLKVAIADGARIVSSASSSAVAAQLTEDVRKYNLRNPGKEIVYINVGSEAYELTAEKCQFWFFRMGTNPYVRMNALVPVMKKAGVLGDKVYSINQNYSYGHDHEKAQAAAVTKAGSKIVESVLHDTNKIQDFSPYISKIKASGAQTVLTGNWANDIMLLMKATGDAGLKVRFGTTSLDTPGTLSNAGPSALGAYMVKIFTMDAGGEKGKAFVEDFKRQIGHYPASDEPTPAFAMMYLGAALKTIDFKGGPIDAKAIAFAIENTSWESPTGTWSMRKNDHQALVPVTVSEVSKNVAYKVDGTDMGFRLLETVSARDAATPVSQACKMDRPA